MAELQGWLFEPSFNRAVKVDGVDERITSDSGVLLLREADHRLGNGFLHALLRQGQVHTAQGIRRFLQEVVLKAKRLGYVVDDRLDAGYTDGETLDDLTDENLRFIGRIKANAVLQRMAAPHSTRPAGRPPKEGYGKIVEPGPYQAESWKHAQRLVLVVVDRPV
jgi:hypothetical protein